MSNPLQSIKDEMGNMVGGFINLFRPQGLKFELPEDRKRKAKMMANSINPSRENAPIGSYQNLTTIRKPTMNIQITEEQRQAMIEALKEAKLNYSQAYELAIPSQAITFSQKWNACQQLIETLSKEQE